LLSNILIKQCKEKQEIVDEQLISDPIVCGNVKYSDYRAQFDNETLFSEILRYIFADNGWAVTNKIEDDSRLNYFSGYQVLLSSNSLNCLIDNYEISSVFIELNLMNHPFKQLIYVRFLVDDTQSAVKLKSLEIDVIDLDRNFFPPYENYLTIKFLPTIIVISIYALYLIKLPFQFKSSINVEFLLNVFIVYLLSRLFYFEFRTEIELRENLSDIFTDFQKYFPLRYLAYLANTKDLTLGCVCSIMCLKSLTYISFNEMIAQILLTFRKCYMDLIGFFIIFICLIVSYALELNLIFGAYFKAFSTFTRSFAALFCLIWGDLDFQALIEHDWRSFYILLSYLIFMIIIMFNLMLAIILGTYDDIKLDPKCRNLHLKLDQYFY
jgi:hypothetical protein